MNAANGPLVLVVEDDDVIRDILEELLGFQGFRVITAIHGQQGLEKLQTGERPALVVLDLMMPVMNGWEMLAQMRKDERLTQLPVIVLSAGGQGQELLCDPCVRFLKKPLRMKDLLDQVTALIA